MGTPTMLHDHKSIEPAARVLHVGYLPGYTGLALTIAPEPTKVWKLIAWPIKILLPMSLPEANVSLEDSEDAKRYSRIRRRLSVADALVGFAVLAALLVTG